MMDPASNELRQQRVARMHATRAADELLIDAIFGDVLLARLPQRDQESGAIASRDPAIISPVLIESL